ncbi:MAG: histidine phosphatase family protein [Deltaproteobacteria bacterium]|nr:histidine phosphatase family protein [Deltaproteobacteria bacterium]
MARPTRIIAVRHGETEWNVEGRLQGSRDSALTERGRKQSERLGCALTKVKLTAAYSSDLGRARETAQIALARASKASVRLELDPRLREISYGRIEGLTWREVEALHPDIHRSMEERRQDFAPPGGESRTELVERITETFKELGRRHRSETIFVVTHGGALSAFLRHILGIPAAERRFVRAENCALNRFDFRGDHFRLVTWGERTHLDLDVDVEVGVGVGVE